MNVRSGLYDQILTETLRRALRLVPEEKRPSVQVKVANAIVTLLREELEEGALLDELVDEEVLGASADRPRTPRRPLAGRSRIHR
jgi:hypothetical protein